MRFLLRFVNAISQGFRTCLKLDAILARQKLHRVAATKIACVNGPLHRNPNSAHVSKNASETQIDTKVTFTVLIVSVEQNEEFQESRVHYTLAGMQSLLNIGEGGFLGMRGWGVGGGGVPETLEPSPGYAPDWLTGWCWILPMKMNRFYYHTLVSPNGPQPFLFMNLTEQQTNTLAKYNINVTGKMRVWSSSWECFSSIFMWPKILVCGD